MVSLYLNSIRRAPGTYILLLVLFVLANLQVMIYTSLEGKINENPLLFTGYFLGLGGYLFSTLIYLYFIIKPFSYEFGNMEMLGYGRYRLIAFFWVQYMVVYLLSFIPSVVALLLLTRGGSFVGTVVAIVTGGLPLMLLYAFILFLYLWGFTRNDPYQLIRGRE